MSFMIIPAVDVKDGKCVRLRQGRMDEETVFSDDPLAMASRWVDAGARRLHVVDLNGAVAGVRMNAAVIEAIAVRFPQVPVQVGGGIRDRDAIRAYLDVGVRYVILGTKAVTTPEFVSAACAEFPEQIMVAIDARDGQVAVNGWERLSGQRAHQLAERLRREGVAALIYTDIGRDGMMSGVNVEATAKLATAARLPVVAAGGVSDLEDIRRLCAVAECGIIGAISGRALYEGKLDLRAAQQLADELS